MKLQRDPPEGLRGTFDEKWSESFNKPERQQGAIMRSLFAIVLAIACGLGNAGASAQVFEQPPVLQNRIPAPLPPPPALPTINGPMIQSPSPGIIAPPALNTFSDRVGNCLQESSGAGLSASDLNAFTGGCVNAN